MKKNNQKIKNVQDIQTIGPTFPPLIKPKPQILQSQNLLYFALGNGKKMIFTNEDAIPSLSTSKILSPRNFSYANLLINGFLQPTTLYTVEKGCLILLTNEAPSMNVPVMLQFIINFIK